MRFSLEDLATLTEDEALRRRFDAHNVRLLRLLLWGFLLVSAVQIPAAGGRTPALTNARLALTLTNLAAVAFLLPVFGRVARGCPSTPRRLLDEAARRVARVPRGAVLAVLAIQFLLVAAFTFLGETREPWFFAYGYLFLFFRFKTVEHVFLSATIVATGLVEALLDALLDGTGFRSEFLVAMALTNAFSLGIALAITRRATRSFRAGWADDHARAKDQLRMRQELELAREIQIGMLPARDPDVPWLDVASVSLPATEVGGDYYGYFTTGSGKLAVVVGDVAGHGLASGLVLSGVRSCLTLLAEELDRPSVVMGKLHRMLQTTARNRMFVTLSIVLFDRDRSKVVTSSAGHPPLLIRRAATGDVEEVLLPALPLGAGLQSSFEEREADVGPGDVLVLHTDGIYEAVGSAGATYGMARLASVVAAGAADATAGGRRDAVIGDLRAFLGTAPQEDDVTLVVMRLLP